MALTNRERIDRAAGALAAVLGPALDRTIAGQIPPGTTWVDLFRIKDTGGSEREYSHDASASSSGHSPRASRPSGARSRPW